jgi:hypothetical protein
VATLPAEDNEFPYVTFAESAAPSTPATGLGLVYLKSDGKWYTKNDAGTEVEITGLPDHLADTTDAHDASAISVLDTAAVFTATNVETALKELYDGIAAGGISPTIFAAKGDILGASANDTPAITSVGANGAQLVADSAQSTGLAWRAAPTIGVYTRTSADYTTTSTSFVDIDGTNLSFTITTLARRVKMGFVGSIFTGATANQQIFLDVTVDGTLQGGTNGGLVGIRSPNDTTQRFYNGSFTYLTDVLSAGSHTFKFQWRVASGTGTITGTTAGSKARWWVEETLFTT